MRNAQILKMIAGFRRFREKIFLREDSIYSRLDMGQSPKTLVIGCSDSRVDPAIISSAAPGEMFVVRNVANLVPPFESAKVGFHGVSAAIEFAVVNLKVENIVILGHRRCGGIHALVTGSQKEDSFLGQWVSIAESAKRRVVERYPHAEVDALCRHCELESIVTSIENLMTFPFVEHAVKVNGLQIFGIYFDLEQGELLVLDEQTNSFRQIQLEHSAQP